MFIDLLVIFSLQIVSLILAKFMLSILYNMSADAYAKLVAHNNTVVQQFMTYKESQERALAEAYSRLAALKEFCAKEREAFEQEKQTIRDTFEREKREIRDAFEREKRETLALERPVAGGTVDTHQLANKELADFFGNF